MQHARSDAPLNAAPTASSSSTRAHNSACDVCKRRKLKCSGTQPCERCVSTDTSCTYGSRSSRATPQSYIRHLEAEVAELQARLQERVLRSPGEGEQPSSHPSEEDVVETIVSVEDEFMQSDPGGEGVSETFNGPFSGLGVLRSIWDLCDQVTGGPRNQYGTLLAAAFDSHSLGVPTTNAIASLTLLPSREVLQRTITVALDVALSCQEFIDRATLLSQVERLYTADPEEYEPADRRALSLVYALLALGRQLKFDSPRAAIVPGISYFRASQATLDTTDCNHLDSIRTTICLANFLLSASMASKAFNFVCIGIGAALRMGLHVYSPSMHGRFSAQDLMLRRQVFAALSNTQAYLASVLGMPLLLKDAAPEQTIPVSEDDLHDEGSTFISRQPLSSRSNSIRFCQLFRISAEVTKSRSFWFQAEPGPNGAYRLDQNEMAQWETRLRQWRETLPDLSDVIRPASLRDQLILRFVDAAITIAVYRPFAHHLIRATDDPEFSPKGLEYGIACVEASTRAVHVAELMDSHALLHPTQWYVTYNLALAASALTLAVLTNRDGAFANDAQTSLANAQDLLTKLGRRSLSARKCSDSLDGLRAAMQEPQSQSLSPRSHFMQAIGVIGHEGNV